MIIVYISIAIVVLSFVYLGYIVVQNLKETKKSLTNLSETAARFQEKVDKINSETNQLTETTSTISNGIQTKKETVQSVIETAKASPEPFKKLFSSIKNTPNPQRETSDSQLTEIGDKLIDLWGRYRVKRKTNQAE
ncbi:DUF948 domain-containing protein [Bacillus sp. NTK071]|uniref:DUF948 domain-containing protein n=1 Tax=Bacillus sp. NTK071 TaxID=2802175 RepID=UPI001A8F46FB|nr:DUF948 domain-containing protein [Bacillus sp. NTK071]MBN8209209.1 DUF948 domain-containing protein [Bacillus sp. NTK071]